MKTLTTHESSIQQAFGIIRFEIGKIIGRGRPARFAWLTEDQATFVMTLSRNTERVVQCKLNLVKAFSEAKQVIQQVIPAQQQEIEKLRLELEVARAQERKFLVQERVTAKLDMLSRSNPVIAALAAGKADAVIEKEHPITVLVDQHGRPIEQFDGVGITFLAKQYGFGRGKKANDRCRAWLRSLGIKDSDWVEEPSAHVTRKLPRELLARLDQAFSAKQGDRQFFVGE